MCGFIVYCADSTGKTDQLRSGFASIGHRGPDRSSEWEHPAGWWGFHRLAIMDVSTNGDQPFRIGASVLVCNGEIYNSDSIRPTLEHSFQSDSDCEVLLPLYRKIGIDRMCHELDGEFAFVLYDADQQKYYAARDPLGIRPLFIGTTADGTTMFASEAKALHELCQSVRPFPPGHWYDGEFHSYCDLSAVIPSLQMPDISRNIRDHLTDAVVKRLTADVPVGFLLSGGLDSSLVCGIATQYLGKSIKTFAIGMEHDAIDLKYARQVADYIKSDHHEVIIGRDDVLRALPKVIAQLESWDITTIRASVGMYLLCEYIRTQTDVRVVLTGEVSDELFGYKYTDFAPDPAAFQAEAAKRIREIYLYDVLRADRCISGHGLESRVPFSDKFFVEHVMRIAPEMKMNHTGIGKYLLRMAFKDLGLIPESILMREKAAFSDAVGHSLVDILRDHADKQYTQDQFLEKAKTLIPVPPSKEALLYREYFDSCYPGRQDLIPAYWLPNQTWQHCQIADPSARYLPNYGASAL